MTCREFVAFLHDYVEGGLPPERRAAFENHLAACPSCAAYLSTYRAAIQMGREALRPTGDPLPRAVPEDLIRAILAVRDQAL